MKRLLAAVLAGLAVCGAGGARQDGPAPKTIDGTYTVVAAKFGGKDDTEKVGRAEFEFKSGTVTVREDGAEKDTAAFKLDPAKMPAEIDLTPGKGPDRVVLGIYKTKATDKGLELTIAFTKDGKARPTDFKGDGADAVLLKLLKAGGK